MRRGGRGGPGEGGEPLRGGWAGASRRQRGHGTSRPQEWERAWGASREARGGLLTRVRLRTNRSSTSWRTWSWFLSRNLCTCRGGGAGAAQAGRETDRARGAGARACSPPSSLRWGRGSGSHLSWEGLDPPPLRFLPPPPSSRSWGGTSHRFTWRIPASDPILRRARGLRPAHSTDEENEAQMGTEAQNPSLRPP